jgi:thioester reductase-like protein
MCREGGVISFNKERLAGLSPAKRALLLQMIRSRRPPEAPAGRDMTVPEMLAEAVLPVEIDPARATAVTGPPGRILLTGATGFVGAYLLEALLQHTGAVIFCLVRAGTVAEAEHRITENLLAYGLAPPDVGRVVAVPGDLAAPGLGLGEARFDQLAQEIDAVHHCGAAVKWTYPYAALRPANVQGTLGVLRLATTARLKAVHFISTVGVFSSGGYRGATVTEDVPLEASGALSVGYAQSKWIAEKLVRLAGARGMPFAVYRPNTGPDSRSGAFNARDYVSQMIKGCVVLRCAPALDLTIDGAPVDYVARAITHLSLATSSGAATYHLVNPRGVSWRDVAGWIGRYGYPIELVGLEAWRRRVAAPAGVPGGFALAPFFTEGVFDQVLLPRFDTARLQADLRGTGIAFPAQGYEAFANCLSYFVRTGFLPPPGNRQPGGEK